MPELAEVKIMSEYINSLTKNRVFKGIRKTETSKQDIIKTEYPFTITAGSRGKELMLHINESGSKSRLISMSMGMTGNWSITQTGYENKHAQLMFDMDGGATLSLVDMRRFAKWKEVDGWSSKRGPCPLTQHLEFVKHIEDGIKNSKAFDKPICELMMDQKWFNGIGNYLRAEILYRVKETVNPFEPAKTALRNCPSILDLCYHVVEESYKAGGGELRDRDWETIQDFSSQIITYTVKPFLIHH